MERHNQGADMVSRICAEDGLVMAKQLDIVVVDKQQNKSSSDGHNNP